MIADAPSVAFIRRVTAVRTGTTGRNPADTFGATVSSSPTLAMVADDAERTQVAMKWPPRSDMLVVSDAPDWVFSVLGASHGVVGVRRTATRTRLVPVGVSDQVATPTPVNDSASAKPRCIGPDATVNGVDHVSVPMAYDDSLTS